MSDDELEKLAAEMQNIQPSKSSRQRGMDAAMKAFDTEFASTEDSAAEKKSQDLQGLDAGTRPTSQSTRTEGVQTFRSVVMSKVKNVFSMNPRSRMLMGSCAAALIASFIILPNTMRFEAEPVEEFAEISSEMGSDEILVTANKVKRAETDADTRQRSAAVDTPQPVAPAPITGSEQNTGGITSVNELLQKVRKDAVTSSSENAARETEFKERQQQAARLGNTDTTLSDKKSQEYRATLQQIDNVSLFAGSADTQNVSQVGTRTVSRRRIKTPARTAERVIPAVTKQETRRVMKEDGTFETISVTVVVQEASTELVTVPATYETITEFVAVERPSRDRFENYESNPITAVKETPVSTFSIDVDTASYSFLRSSINRGQLPSAGSIRLEEMINYFPYDYEAPDSADEPFKANVTVTPSPWNADTKLMHIGIKGYVPSADEKPHSNIVFLIDTSGSMNQANKLPLLINSFKLLLGTLDEDDRVSIVTYAGSAGTVLEPTPASDKKKINEALSRLRAGGSTAGAAGLELAYQKAAESYDDEGVNRVILATDGDFNVGFSSPDEMKTFIEKKRKTGIFLSVLGFGNGNYNDHLMQSLAQNGNGVAAYIDSLAEANKVLADEAGSALITIAKDVKIQVEFNPATISDYRLIGYETRALKREDFNNDKIDAGEIGAGHSVTAIYELTPVGSPLSVDDLRYVSGSEPTSSGSDELAFVKIRHKLPNADKSTLQTFPIGPDNERRMRRASDDMRFATAVAAVGQKLRGDTQLADFSYADAIKLANSAKGDDEHGYRAEFVQLVRLIDGLQD